MIRFKDVTQTTLHPRWLQVRRMMDEEDGQVYEQVHCFPIETIALRAGEYGLPLDRPRDILEVVTYESTPGFHEEGQLYPLLVTEPTLEAGRRKHLERVVKVRAEHEGRAGRRTLAAQRALDDVHEAVCADIVRRSDLDPELARLGAYLLAQQAPAAHRRYLEREALMARQRAGALAANGDGTSTLKEHLLMERRHDEHGRMAHR